MKDILLLFSVLLLFTACEYSNDYYFEITNDLSDSITVHITNSRDDASNQYLGEEHVIRSGETKRIFRIWGGVSYSNYYPKDEFESNEILPPCDKFEIYIYDTLLSENISLKIRQRQYWSYKTSEHLGIYNLKLTNEILH